MDAHDHPPPVKLVLLNPGQEIPGVDEVHGVHLAPLLVHVRADRRDKGLTLVAGNPPAGGDSLGTGADLPHLRAALPRPGAAEGQHTAGGVGQVQAGGQRPVQPQGTAAPIDDPDAAGDDVQPGKGGVVQFHHHAGGPVRQGDFQRIAVRLLTEGGREAVQFGFSRQDFTGREFRHTVAEPRAPADRQTALLEVAGIGHRVLHGEAVKKGGLLPGELVRRVGPLVDAPVVVSPVQPLRCQPGAVVHMAQPFPIGQGHYIAGAGRIQTKSPLSCITDNIHTLSSIRHDCNA